MVAAALTLAGILSLVETGIQAGVGDHPIHLSYVYRVMDPDLFSDDPFVATVNQYPSVFWKTIAAFASAGVPLNVFLYGGHLFFRVLAVGGLFFLYREIARQCVDAGEGLRTWIAIAGTFASLGFNAIHWGGTFMLEPTLETSSAAFSVLPWTWLFWIRRAWTPWAVGFGAVTWIHPMIGTYAALIFGCLWVAEGNLFTWRNETGRAFWFRGGVPGAVLAGSGVFYAWLHTSGMSEEMREAWVVIARYRLGHHLFPEGWALSQFVLRAVIAAVLFAACVAATTGRLRRLMIAGFLPVATLTILGIAAPRIFPHPTLLSLCLWRSPMAWTLAAAGVLIPFFFHAARAVVPREKLLIPVLAASILFLGGLSALKYQRRQAWFASPEQYAVENWVRENTAKDSLLLAPPQHGGIRTGTMRPSFVEWKDGSAILWDVEYTRDVWMRRLAVLAGRKRFDDNTGLERPPTRKEIEEDYAGLMKEPERLRKILEEYGIDYVVVDTPPGRATEQTLGRRVAKEGDWEIHEVQFPGAIRSP